jgi:glycosyltransferase involved in cell wall biosynthesis
MKSVFFGPSVEVTAEKGGAPFALWLRPAHDDTGSYRQTAALKIGYSGEPPDPAGYKLLDALCARVARWEESLPQGAISGLFDPAPPSAGAADPSAPPLDADVQSWLSRATVTPVHQEWLAERERGLAAHFAGLKTAARSVLLVNATLGLQYYPSIVDYFALLQQSHPEVRVASASYFGGIHQFHQGVARKGLRVVPIAEVGGWGAEDFNRFDVVLLVGPSAVMAGLMAMAGLTARLVFLDLAFYHQLIEQYPKAFYNAEDLTPDKAAQRNTVVCYSCQPEDKVRRDLAGFCRLSLLEWRWFNYIPIGFAYGRYYRSDQQLFDVALLGSASRDYSRIDPARFGGVRFLFLGSLASVPALQQLQGRIDLTVAPQVDPDVYARLLALCRCVALPLVWSSRPQFPGVTNAFVSLLDAVASGKPLVIPRHEGARRLEREGLPAVFYEDSDPDDFSRQVTGLLRDERRVGEVGARSLDFARRALDIYRVLGTILEEEVL